MRSASVFLLFAGIAGAASAAGTPLADDRLDVQVTSEVTTGGMTAPSGVPVQQSTLNMRYRAEGWTLQAELPWRRVAGLRDTSTSAVPGTRAADEGLADARLHLVVPLRQAAPDATRVDMTVSMRSGGGTAVGGLDTGRAGQAMGLALQRGFGDWNVFGQVGWQRAGSLPGTDRGRNALNGEVGVARQLSSRLQVGVYADLRQRVGSDPALPEATLYTALGNADSRWQAFVTRAFSPTVQDVSVGLSYRANF